MENVHSLSAFELRQEFSRLQLELPQPTNQTTMMKALITHLVREKERQTRTYTTEEEVAAEREALRARLEAEKAARKADGERGCGAFRDRC